MIIKYILNKCINIFPLFSKYKNPKLLVKKNAHAISAEDPTHLS